LKSSIILFIPTEVNSTQGGFIDKKLISLPISGEAYPSLDGYLSKNWTTTLLATVGPSL
jgi:hypothetical protein